MKESERIDRDVVLGIIERLDIFSEFTLGERLYIAALHNHFALYQPGEFLIKEGNFDDSFFILLDGSVSITKGNAGVCLATLSPSDFFGETSLLYHTRRTSNVVADERVIVFKLSKQMLKDLKITVREKIKDKVIEKLLERLNQMNNAYVNLTHGANV